MMDVYLETSAELRIAIGFSPWFKRMVLHRMNIDLDKEHPAYDKDLDSVLSEIRCFQWLIKHLQLGFDFDADNVLVAYGEVQ